MTGDRIWIPVIAGAGIAAIAARLGVADVPAFLVGCGVALLVAGVQHRWA